MSDFNSVLQIIGNLRHTYIYIQDKTVNSSPHNAEGVGVYTQPLRAHL